MLTINCQNVKKYNAAQLVLENVTFELRHGERAGLVGRNGCGKTTLLRMIAKLDAPDDGLLAVRKDARIGYLEQVPAEASERTVYETLASGYRELIDCRTAMADLEARMSQSAEGDGPGRLEAWLEEYAKLQERYERDGGYEMDARIDQVAFGLGIARAWYDREYASLSGGEKTKVGLAAELIRKPELLLLDEPTNHLDMNGVEWLEDYLRKYAGACLIVSHDRYFLDRVVTKIVELEDGESSTYHGNYTFYAKEKEERLLQEFADYQEQQKKIKKMREAIKRLMEWGRIGDNGKFFRRAASMQKALDRMEKLKRPAIDRKEAEFGIVPQDRSGKRAVVFAGLSKRYGDAKILDGAEGLLEYGDKVMLVGRNGAGKSTLLKLILGEERPDEGELAVGSRVEIGYLAQNEAPPQPKQSVLAYFRREAGLEEGEARSRLAAFQFYGAEAFKSVGSLSGGEWTRLRLALLVLRKPNLLILDEPTNHMDIASREALEEALEEYPGTILAVTHDRYFINWLSRKIWGLENGRLTVYLGDYEAYKRRCDDKSGSGQTDEARSRSRRSASAHADAPRELETGDPERLEKEIGDLERQLAVLDERAADAADPEELEKSWAERERIRRELDELYEKWAALALNE